MTKRRSAVLGLGLLMMFAVASIPASAAAGDTTEYVVEVQEDGDAVWTVKNVFQLDTEDERTAFQEISTDKTGQRVSDAFRQIVASASDRTDREMSVTEVSTSKSIQDGTGTVEVTLTWTGFASPDGEALSVGDVFPEGFSLSKGEVLRIEAPSGYSADRSDLSWSGPDEGLTGTISLSPSGTEDSPDGEGEPAGTTPGLTGVAALVALAGYAVRRG